MRASVVLLGNSPSLANKKNQKLVFTTRSLSNRLAFFCHFRFQLEKMSVQVVQCFGPFVRG